MKIAINYIHEYNASLYKVSNIRHIFGINCAISSNQNPTASEMLLSMALDSGVTINASCYIASNLTISTI